MASLGDLFVRVGADISGFRDAMGELKTSLGRVSGDMKSAGMAMTAFFTVPIAGVAIASVKAAGEMEALKMAMNTITKSAGQTSVQLERLKEVAKLPGLGFKEAVQGSINLQSAGFSAQLAERSLKAFGNALATVGKGRADLEGVNLQLTQMIGKPAVLASDLNPLRERLPQITQMMKNAFGTSVSEDLKALGVTGRDFVEKMITEFEKLPAMTGGFNNSMENMKDQIFLTSVALGESLLPVAQKFMDWASGAVGKLKEVSEGFAGMSKPAQNATLAVASFLALLGPGTFLIGSFVSSLGHISKALAAFGVSGAAAATAGGILLGVAMAAGIVEGLAQKFPAIAAALNIAFGGGHGAPSGKSHWTFGNQNPFFLGTARNSFGGSGEFSGPERSGLPTGSPGDFGGEFGGALAAAKAAGLDTKKIAEAFSNLGVKNLALELAEAEAAFRLLTAAGKLNAGQSQESQDHIAQLRFELERLAAGLSATREKLNRVPFAEKSREGALLTAQIDVLIDRQRKMTKDIAESGLKVDEFFIKKMGEAQESVERFNTIVPPAATWEAPIKDAGKALKEVMDLMPPMLPLVYELADAFKFFGIKSASDMEKLAAEAEKNFGLIRKSGEGSAIDIARAWVKSSQARIDADLAAGAISQATYKDLSESLNRTENDIKRASGELQGATKKGIDFGRQISTVFTDLGRSLTDVIFGTKRWGDALMDVGKSAVRMIMEEIIGVGFAHLKSGLKELIKDFGGLGKVLSSIFGGAAKTGTDAITGAAGAGSSAAGGATGAVGAASSGLMGTITAISGIATAVSSIVGNFQFAGMNKSLDVIVNHTLRQFNEIFQQRIDHWEQFNQTYTRLGEIWNTLKSGAGGVSIDLRNSNFGGVTQQSIEAMFQAAWLKAQAARG